MVEFLIRLMITVLVIWLVQVILEAFKLKEPASRIIFVVVISVMVVWLLLGYQVLPLK